MRGRVALAVAVVVAAIATHDGEARADEKTCVIDQVSGLLECTLVASPAPPRHVLLSPDLPLEWIRLAMNMDELIQRGIGCVRNNAGVREVGVGYAIALNNTATGEQLYLDFVCTWPGEEPPLPPPPPPTPGEFKSDNAEALTVRPTLNPAPTIGGLTGLDSWFWCTDPGLVDAGVSLRGWTAVGAVEVVQLDWQISETTFTSTTCGSEGSPAVTWMPEATGDYPISLTATWAGTWDLSWNGIPMGAFPLGPVSLTSPTQTYPVAEYRGELTG